MLNLRQIFVTIGANHDGKLHFLLRDTIDQLLCHCIELQFQLPDFVLLLRGDPLCIITPGKFPCGRHQAELPEVC